MLHFPLILRYRIEQRSFLVHGENMKDPLPVTCCKDWAVGWSLPRQYSTNQKCWINAMKITFRQVAVWVDKNEVEYVLIEFLAKKNDLEMQDWSRNNQMDKRCGRQKLMTQKGSKE